MATKIEKDAATGQYTTGHEWDGIKELNTPLPKWWVFVFYATIVWAIGYWIVYPSFPTLSGYSHGLFNYSSRAQLNADLIQAKLAKAGWLARFETAKVEDIAADKELLGYAQAGGKVLFNENCAPCHGSGGAGGPAGSGYPILADDIWLWGGTLADIQQTISFGVRNDNPNSRITIMPSFGADKILAPQQINDVAEYVLSLTNRSSDAKAAAAGQTVFAENCVACHGEGGVGNNQVGAPPLNTAVWLYGGGKENIMSQVTKPRLGSMPAWSERLDATAIKQLAIYVHSLGGGK